MFPEYTMFSSPMSSLFDSIYIIGIVLGLIALRSLHKENALLRARNAAARQRGE